MMDRCRLLKAGFINYYKYKDYVFDFHSNHIVFRGDNGAGKSLTAGSLFPNIFTMNDSRSLNLGDKSRSKDIRYYTKSNQESYIWLMFQIDETFHTLVIGYYKKSDGTVNRRGFIMKDNVKYEDVSFYGDGDNGELLSLADFRSKNKELIEFYSDTSIGYREAINNKFYKFPTLEDYDYFVDACSLLTKTDNVKRMSSNNSKIDKLYLEQILMQALPDAKSNIKSQLLDFVKTVKDLRDAKISAEESKANVENIVKLENLIEQKNLPQFARITRHANHIENLYDKSKKDLDSKSLVLGKTKEDSKLIHDRLEEIKIEKAQTTDKINILENIIKESGYEDLVNKRIEKDKEVKFLMSNIDKSRKRLEEKQTEFNKQSNLLSNSEEDLSTINIQIDELYKIKDLLWNFKTEDNLLLAINNQIKLIESIDALIRSISLQKDVVANNKRDYENKAFNYDGMSHKVSIIKKELKKDYLNWFKAIDLDISSDLEFDEILEDSIYEDHVESRKKTLIEPLYSLRYNKNKLYKELEELKEELERYHKEYSLDKQAEFESGIQLYELIDFKEDIDEEFKLKIEASLSYSRLLFTVFNAKGINESLTTNDIKNANIKNNLLDLFDVQNGIDEQLGDTVKGFLSNISYNNDGSINTNLVTSISQNTKDSVVYIGEENRRIERERKIKELQASIESKNEELEQIESNILFYKKEADQFEKILKNKPDKYEYFVSLKSLKMVEDDLNSFEKILDANIEKLSRLKEDKENKIINMDKRLPGKTHNLFDIKQQTNEFISLSKQKNNCIQMIDFYKDNIVGLGRDLNSINDNIIQLNNDKEILEELIINIEKELKVNKDYESNIGEIKHLKNKLDDLCNLEINIRTDIGKYEERLKNLEDEVKKLKEIFDTNKEIKNVKDELINIYGIPRITKKVEDFTENDKVYTLLRAINESKSDFVYRVELESLRVKGDYPYVGDISSIVNDIKNISFVNYKDLDGETIPRQEAITSVERDVERYTATYDEQRDKIETQLFADGIFEPVSEVIKKAENIALSITKKMEDNFRPDKTSIKAVFSTSDSVHGARAKRKLLKGELEKSDVSRVKIIERLVNIVNSFFDENQNVSDEDIADALYEELDYKKLYRFKLKTYKKNERDWRNVSSNYESDGGSEGENIRGLFEIFFAIVSASMEKAELKDTMPSVVILDEAFEGVSPGETERLEGLMIEIFNIFIAASYTYMVQSDWDVDYITIEDCSDENTDMLYLETMAVTRSKVS